MQTDTGSQPKKSSSPTKTSKKKLDVAYKLATNTWWPFDRVDGRLLEKLHKQSIINLEEAPL